MYFFIILILFLIIVIYFIYNKYKGNESFHQYKYTAVIIEPREHPALEYVLKNFNDNLSNEWQFVVFHGNKNIEYTKNICNKVFIPDRIKMINLGVDNLTISDYSGLFYKPILYNNIPTEIFLIFQTDAIICSKHKELINEFISYDYVGAPWPDEIVGNGGLSLRKKSKMLEVVEKCKNNMNGENYINEDMVFAHGCNVVNLNKPSFEKAKEFSIELVDHDKSFGIHKAYAYLDVKKLGEWCPEIIKLKELNS